MTKKNGPNIGHNKKSFLNNPVEHIDITSFDARKIIESMSKMSFTSRDTANAAKIYNEMISDENCSIFLTIAGSTSAGGCMNLYTDLVIDYFKIKSELEEAKKQVAGWSAMAGRYASGQ